MPPEEKAFHEKYIKGINLKIIITVGIALVSSGWWTKYLVDDIESKIEKSTQNSIRYTDKRVDTAVSKLENKIQSDKDYNMQTFFDMRLLIQKVAYHKPIDFVTETYKIVNGKRVVTTHPD